VIKIKILKELTQTTQMQFKELLTFGLVCWKCTLVTILLRMKCII